MFVNHSIKQKTIPVVLFSLASLYYIILSAKQYTWVFGSGDSGGWLASALTWQLPQPFGNPVYVLLGHLLAAFPGDLVIKYTIVGSCLPSAITVALVYMITREITGSMRIGVLSSCVLLAAAVFLSQSTTLSQYPLAVLSVVLAFRFYLKGNRKLAVISIGLGTAMHVVVGVIALVWLLLEWRRGELKYWSKLLLLFFIFSLLPYTFTLWELWHANGTINIHVLSNFASNTSGAGGLVIQLLPERLLRYAAWLAVSFGVVLLPVYYGIRSIKGVTGYGLLLTPVVFVSWYYLTAQDPTVWHYLPWVIPSMAIVAGIGIHNMPKWKPLLPLTVIWILGALTFNALYLNADSNAKQHPNANMLYNNIATLPENALVASDRLGAGATLRYVIASSRPDIKHIPLSHIESAIISGEDVYVIDINTLEVTKWDEEQ